MSKKIIACGGGNIGEVENGFLMPYETQFFDEEIINLSDARKPKILFLGLADPENIKKYFYYFSNVFSKRYGCLCKCLELSDLHNGQKINDIFDWCDVVYIGGGNTFTLVNLCRNYGITDKLLLAYNQGKVMSGISAGGMCWFKYGNSVNPNNRGKLIKQDCFGFKNMVFAPHCDEINGHFENVENLILNENLVALSLSNCSALEIVDDKYRLLSSSSSMDRYKIEPFAIRSFWKDKEYIMEDMSLNDDYSNLFELLNPSSLYNTDVKDNVKRLLKRRDIYFK